MKSRTRQPAQVSRQRAKGHRNPPALFRLVAPRAPLAEGDPILTRLGGEPISKTNNRLTCETVGVTATYTVLVVGGDALRRVGIETVISQSPDLAVVGEAEGGREAVRLCHELRPSLLLVDLEALEAGGLEAIRSVPLEHPETSVLVLVANEDEDTLLEVVRAGATGYVPRDFTAAQLLNAARRSAQGMSALNRELAMRLLRQLDRRTTQEATEALPAGGIPTPPENVGESPLTPRELEVVAHIAKGRTNRQIAQDLHVSLSTVKRHLEHIIAKLEVADRTQAAVKAASLGLLTGN